MVISDRIKALFEEKGIKNKYVCEQLGISRNKVFDFKRGKSTPTQSELMKLAEIFDVSVDYLTGKTDIKKSPSQESEELTQLIQNSSKDVQKAIRLLNGLDEEKYNQAMAYLHFLLDARDKK